MISFKSYLTEAARETWYFDPILSMGSDLLKVAKKVAPKSSLYVADGGLYFYGSRLLAKRIASELDQELGMGNTDWSDFVKSGNGIARNWWKNNYSGNYAKDNAFVNNDLPWLKEGINESEAQLKKAGVSGYNQPKKDTSGGSSHVVVAKDGDKTKLIRFGQAGVKGSPDGTKRNKAFKARHAKNIKKGKMSAAYWANKVKW